MQGREASGVSQPIIVGSEEFNADPAAHYDWLRREAPVYKGRLPYVADQDVYFLSRHQDCVSMLTDPRFRRSVEGAPPLPFPKAIRFLTTDNMILKDDPEHRRLRRLVSKPFTPRAVARLGERVDALTRGLLDELEPGREVDLQQAYALPVPVTVINEMMGVPAQDRSRFHGWMDLMIEGMAKYGIEKAAEYLESPIEYVRDLIERRRHDPAEDIMTGLIHAAEGGETLTDDELVAMVFTLIGAGYETTYHLITNGVATLLAHPDQLERLREDPELMPSAVEEILRYSGPVGGTKPNYPAEDVELHWVTIPRASIVMPLLASANRDPAAFEEPETFDIGRTPNDHIAFGTGHHFCLGASLARLETRIALKNLIERFPRIRLAVDPEELQVAPLPLWHRLRGLPVVLG
ncbi:MAG: cytochrome P450 family protein [Actinomycetota bacterium]